MAKDAQRFLRFKETWVNSSVTIQTGVSIKGPFDETETTVSIQGSYIFRDIPKAILEEVTAKAAKSTMK